MLLAFAGIASAAVHVNIAVTPSSIPQCGRGHVALALANDGTSPILARLCFSLLRADTLLFGPICVRVPLAAGQHRAEFDFIVPPRVRPADYAIAARAEGSDGSSDQAAAPFTIVPATGACPASPAASDPNADLLNGVVLGSGMTVESPTPTHNSTWGQLKILYR